MGVRGTALLCDFRWRLEAEEGGREDEGLGTRL